MNFSVKSLSQNVIKTNENIFKCGRDDGQKSEDEFFHSVVQLDITNENWGEYHFWCTERNGSMILAKPIGLYVWDDFLEFPLGM